MNMLNHADSQVYEVPIAAYFGKLSHKERTNIQTLAGMIANATSPKPKVLANAKSPEELFSPTIINLTGTGDRIVIPDLSEKVYRAIKDLMGAEVSGKPTSREMSLVWYWIGSKIPVMPITTYEITPNSGETSIDVSISPYTVKRQLERFNKKKMPYVVLN